MHYLKFKQKKLAVRYCWQLQNSTNAWCSSWTQIHYLVRADSKSEECWTWRIADCLAKYCLEWGLVTLLLSYLGGCRRGSLSRVVAQETWDVFTLVLQGATGRTNGTEFRQSADTSISNGTWICLTDNNSKEGLNYSYRIENQELGHQN